MVMDSDQHQEGRMGIGHDRELEEAYLVNQNQGWQVDAENRNVQQTYIAMVCCIIDIIIDITHRSCWCSCYRPWFCMSTISFNCFFLLTTSLSVEALLCKITLAPTCGLNGRAVTIDRYRGFESTSTGWYFYSEIAHLHGTECVGYL